MLCYCYVTLPHLMSELRYNIEYLRTLGTALLVWDKWYDNLRALCHAQESCEVLLARLVATMRPNPQCKSLDSACYLFLVLKAACYVENHLHAVSFSEACMNMLMAMYLRLRAIC